jgi:A/G-specific adenine glycosylase
MGFSHLIIAWYEENKRDLPWRHTSDPYRIWVSEIILQQTRVEQGLDYYHRFIGRFPDVQSLAIAEEEEIMKIWQGLGYYSRARNMHHAAKTILHENQSAFPASYDELRKMKGVGDYSASAISSIAFGESQPVVDGNVMRVVARYMGITEPVNTTAGRKKVKQILSEFIDPVQPGIFNQAVMELGALVCKPKQPLCMQCPVMQDCHAFLNKVTNQLPVLAKARLPKVRFFNYLIIISRKEQECYLWLKKRTDNDIWKNLYDFPLIESERALSLGEIMAGEQWKDIAGLHELSVEPEMETARHLLTHRELRVNFILVRSDDYHHPEYLKVSLNDLHKYPVPRLIENILKKIVSRPGIFFKFPD